MLAVICLQEAGEFRECADDGVMTSAGLSYDPEDFTRRGVAHIHAGWKAGVLPEMAFMLRIVHVRVEEQLFK